MDYMYLYTEGCCSQAGQPTLRRKRSPSKLDCHFCNLPSLSLSLSLSHTHTHTHAHTHTHTQTYIHIQCGVVSLSLKGACLSLPPFTSRIPDTLNKQPHLYVDGCLVAGQGNARLDDNLLLGMHHLLCNPLPPFPPSLLSLTLSLSLCVCVCVCMRVGLCACASDAYILPPSRVLSAACVSPSFPLLIRRPDEPNLPVH
jgi:hypothetical protein